LIDDLLDLTKIANGKLELNIETVDVHGLVRAALDVTGEELRSKNLHLGLDLTAPRHLVKGDPARLEQVFWNLIKNAVKFTPADGRIDIRSYNEGEMLRIEVADTGIGIDPNVIPHIFNAFEQGEKTITRRYGGLGLGLAISKMLIDLHDGSIVAHSAGAGRGATFTVDLDTVDVPAGSTSLNGGNGAVHVRSDNG
jgi:signal transduction histidine kinase